MGMVAAQSGKSQEAETDYRRALEKEPNRSGTQLLLLNQYVQNGHFDDALKMLDDRIKKEPTDANTYAMEGSIYAQMGKTQQAKQNYAAALERDPNQDLAANNLAYTLAEEGHDLDKALGLAQGVRKRHPEDPTIADTLGWVYSKLGRPVLALEPAKFAVSKQPDNGAFLYHLGIIYKDNNQNADAESTLKKVVAIKKDFNEKKLADATLKDIYRWRHLVAP